MDTMVDRLMGKLGPRRKIVAEELITPEGKLFPNMYEILSCGHKQQCIRNDHFDHTVKERCCKACLNSDPVIPVGRILSRIDF